ncbi:MAG: hypothetical protein ACP5OA_02450 [Candidatus Woesearchaeota archaeon]
MAKRYIGRAPSEPYQNLREEKEYFRDTLTDIIEKEYIIARKNDWDLGSVKVQSDICRKFLETVTSERIDTYCKSYDNVLSEREIKLKDHVKSIINQIKNWEKYDSKTKKSLKYNEDLGEKQYVKVVAKYINTETVREIIVPVGAYLSEKEMDKRIQSITPYDTAMQQYEEDIAEIKNSNLSASEIKELLEEKVKEKPRKYLPSFSDIDPNIDLSKIEILAVSNVTILYDKNKVADIDSEDVPFEELTRTKALKYAIYSRVKKSFRETEKFVDDLLNLRTKKDIPYDDIGVIVQVPRGEEVYNILNYIIDTSSTYPEIGNTHTKRQNEKKTKDGNIVLKLRDDNYTTVNGKLYRVCDPDNLKAVLEQIIRTESSVDKEIREKAKSSSKEKYLLTNDEIEQEKQGIKVGHTIGTFKCETYLMLPKMLETYFGKHIGHGADYFRRREIKREKYLLNPAESPAYKDILNAKASKKAGRKSAEEYNEIQEELPRVDLIARFLETLFLPAYHKTKYEEDIYLGTTKTMHQ